MSLLQSQLQDQQKIIEFLASKYEKDTGRKITLPSTLGTLLGDDSIVAEESKDEEAIKAQLAKDIVSFQNFSNFSISALYRSSRRAQAA